MVAELGKMIATLHANGDPDAGILPWYSHSLMPGDFLKSAQNITSNVLLMQKYFPRIYFRPATHQVIYTSICIAHSSDRDEVLNNLKTWLVQGQHAMYLQAIQCEQTTELGWLLYSSLQVDTDSILWLASLTRN